MPPSANRLTRKHYQNRRKLTPSLPRFFREGEQISRLEALRRICHHVESAMVHPEALRLITLFNIDPDELAEAGISYECLKVLERWTLFQWLDYA